MVLASGAFDGLHAGHVRYLHAAKALCEPDELLICGIAPDSYISTAKRRAAKWPLEERLMTVNALMVVDAAVAQPHESVASLIREHRPRLFVKGPDWKGRIPEDVYRACEEVGTSIAFVETEGTHVSETRTSDEDALARFEALVLSQKPPTEPWQPVTPFDYESRKAIEGPHPQLILDVFRPRRVLDVGCGPGHLVRLLRECLSPGVLLIEGCDVTPQIGHPWFFRLDISSDLPSDDVGEFLDDHESDLVIAREVLEHLTVRQIRQAVANLCTLSSRFVYVTTRFAKEPDSLLSADTQDGLDPTHISMLNQTFLRALFVLEGFKRRADLEAAMDWKKLGRVLVYERAC